MAQKFLILIAVMLLIAVAGVSAETYHYVCLTGGQTLTCHLDNGGTATYTCTGDCCGMGTLCADESGCWVNPGRCMGLQPCSCDGGGENDGKAPIITINKPVLDFAYSSRSVPFDISLDEVASSLEYQEVGKERYGWIRLCPGRCTAYTGSRSFDDGAHTITVRSADSWGNADTEQTTFYVDSLDPRIRGMLPKAGAYSTGAFTLQYTENNVVRVDLFYASGGTTTYTKVTKTDCPSGATECKFTVTGLPQGSISYYFELTDRAQTVKTAAVTVIVDTAAPQLTVTEPTKNVYSATAVPVKITTNEPADLSITEGAKITSLCKKCSVFDKTVTFVDGHHTITIKAVDGAGNPTQTAKEFFVDSKKPIIRTTKPILWGRGEFSVTYDEANPTTVTLFYKENTVLAGGTYHPAASTSCAGGTSQTCVFTAGGLSQGPLSYYFEIQDVAGSIIQSKVTTLTIDTIAPVITFVKPDQTIYDTRSIQFELHANELTKFEYKDNSDKQPSWKQLCTNCKDYNNKQTLVDGEHKLSIRAIDAAGNADTEDATFIVDSVGPRIKNTDPKLFGNGDFSVIYDEKNPTSVKLYYSASATGPFTPATKADCPGGINAKCIVPVTGLADGPLYYYFTITDITGRTATQTRPTLITIDTVKPVLTITAPVTGSVFTDGRILFNLASSEESVIEYKNVGATVWTNICTKCTAFNRIKYFVDGTYSLEIRARDAAGNTDTKPVGFTVN